MKDSKERVEAGFEQAVRRICYAPLMLAQPRIAGRHASRVRTVSQINAEARFFIEERYRVVWIEGEVSNFRPYASGHWYFSLKDDQAQLKCVMFASRNRFVRFMPANGQTVVLRGYLSLYEARGDFQAVVDHMAPGGEGALRAAYERLKQRLDSEGLFAEHRKRPLPKFPRHVAIISSRDGAALRDVLAVTRRRFPSVRLTCFYVAVQGLQAEGQLLGAFDRAERMRHTPDVIVVTRGGGSLEDLAAFNLESVARRIAAARVPVVSAIGHETDITITDLVADRRAPTPSAAAELVTPDGAELLNRMKRLEATITARLGARLRSHQRLLTAVARRVTHPRRKLEQRQQRIDELAERAVAAMRTSLQRSRTKLAHQDQLLARVHPEHRIALAADRVARAKQRLDAASERSLATLNGRFATLGRALSAVSPLATLDRGYAILAKPDGSRWGKPVVSVDGARAGDVLVAHLADGTLRTKVEA